MDLFHQYKAWCTEPQIKKLLRPITSNCWRNSTVPDISYSPDYKCSCGRYINFIRINSHTHTNDSISWIRTGWVKSQPSLTWKEINTFTDSYQSSYDIYEGNSISKLQIVIEKNRMEIMTYKQHLFFNIISIQI